MGKAAGRRKGLTRAGLQGIPAEEQTQLCIELLEAVATRGTGEALSTMHGCLGGDRQALGICRSLGAIDVVADAWRARPASLDVAAAAAMMLLSYAAAHAEALRLAGVDALCAQSMACLGAVAATARVARLWCRISKPPPRDVLALLARAVRCSALSADCARPLLQTLKAQHGVEELKGCQACAVLDTLLDGELAQEAMGILCKIAEPLEAPPCTRGSIGDLEADGSESDDEPEAEDLLARPPVDITATTSVSSADEPPDDVESRKSALAALLEGGLETTSCTQTADPCADACAPLSVAQVIDDFRAHLYVDVAAAKSWPIAFPRHPEDDAGGNMPRFAASFEGGNLRQVRLEGDGSFEVLLCGDTNRSAHCQWFCFDVEVSKPRLVRFHIIMAKPSSTFSRGQRVAVREPGQTDWQRAGIDYVYFPNRYAIASRRGYYTLAFSLPLLAGRTRVAHFFPYLFNDLLGDLRRLHPAGDWLEVQDLGPTAGSRPLLMLTVTDFAAPREIRRQRHCVVISARVHPGEAPASFMMRGVLEALLSSSSEAQSLRKGFVFVVFPMLNPDGVADGNGRANSAGLDLNRHWESPPASSEIAAVKGQIERLHGTYHGGVLAFLDLHAHARRHGVFTLSNPSGETLPDLLASSGAVAFDRTQCNFRATAAKRGSARCVAWRELGVVHAHTVEATYAALPDRSRLVTLEDLQDVGRALVRACACLGPRAPRKRKVSTPSAMAGDAAASGGKRKKRRRTSAAAEASLAEAPASAAASAPTEPFQPPLEGIAPEATDPAAPAAASEAPAALAAPATPCQDEEATAALDAPEAFVTF